MNLLIRRCACVAGIVGIVLCGNPAFAQQWERLPLNVGYLDKLVQNPYNPLEIVGYVQSGDFYRSIDGGLRWKKVVQDSVPFKRDFLSLTLDSRNRLYVIVAFEGLYRSSDGGLSWDSLHVPGPGYLGGFSKTMVIEDGTIFIWKNGDESLIRSQDDGASWEEIGPPDPKQVWDMYIDGDDGRVIVMLEYEKAVVTTDGGTTWFSNPLPAPARSNIFPYKHGDILSLRYLSGRNSSEIYESVDTGRTWQQETRQTIQINQGDCNSSMRGSKYFRMNDSTDVCSFCHTLQRSTDSGQSFQQITDFRVEDAVQVGTDLIASVPLRGLVRSTDFGDTWSPVPSPPEMLRVNELEFVHAHDDTMFVLMGDWDTNSRSTRILLESDDGGYRWDTLFSSRSNRLWELFTDAGRPSRYFLHTGVPDDRYGDPKNRYSILSGVAGQTVPDTVLVTTSFPRPTDIYPPQTFQCFPSERFQGWIYASCNTNSIGWSSNRGESWQWRTLPISCSMVRPWPTQGDPLRLVVAAYELNPIPAFDYSGLYLMENDGQSFEWINRNSRSSGRFFTTGSDRIFNGDSSSTDYGRTWSIMRTGLDSATTSVDNYQSHGRTLTITNTGMYLFDDGRWKLLRDAQGNSIWDERMVGLRHGAAIFLDYSGTHVYVAIPDRGLYRIATQPVTGVMSPPIPTIGRLTAYPNPAGTQVTIAWQGGEGSPDGFVRILDVLGREAARFETPSGGKSIRWDCAGPAGLPVPPGLYFVQLSDGRQVATTNVLILR